MSRSWLKRASLAAAFLIAWAIGASATVYVGPTLSSPTNGATNQPTSLTLTWGTAANAATYNVMVSTSTSFTTTVSSQTGLTTLSASVSGLANSMTYYWEVDAVDASSDISAWSTPYSFTTVPVAAPGAPVLSSPSDNAMNQPVAGLTLSWTSGTGGPVTSYAVQVGTSTTFSTTVLSMSGLTTTSQASPTLASSTKYYWEVTATGNGTAMALDSFTTAMMPGSPTLSSPSNGASGLATSLTLSWTTASNAATYAVQVSTGSGFATTVASQTGLTGTSASISGLAYLTTYYWRAGAKGLGGVSGWATPYSFTTMQIPAPAAPALASPTNNAANLPDSLTLGWNTVTGAATYSLILSTVSDCSSKVFTATQMTTTSVNVAGLAAGTLYYWEVSAANTSGTSPWSTIWSFTTSPASSVLPVASAKLAKTEFSVKGASLVYSLSVAGPVGITFSDLLGKTALTMNRTQAAGRYAMALKDFSLAAGRYIVQFKAAGIVKRQVVCIER